MNLKVFALKKVGHSPQKCIKSRSSGRQLPVRPYRRQPGDHCQRDVRDIAMETDVGRPDMVWQHFCPIVEGELQNGTEVDVYNSKTGTPSFEKPARVAATYANYRWRKCLPNLEEQSYRKGPQPLALNYSRYLCRLWNNGVPYKKKLKTYNIHFNVERTPPLGETKIVKTRLVWTHDCFG